MELHIFLLISPTSHIGINSADIQGIGLGLARSRT